jgi:hypothetical protein
MIPRNYRTSLWIMTIFLIAWGIGLPQTTNFELRGQGIGGFIKKKVKKMVEGQDNSGEEKKAPEQNSTENKKEAGDLEKSENKEEPGDQKSSENKKATEDQKTYQDNKASNDRKSSEDKQKASESSYDKATKQRHNSPVLELNTENIAKLEKVFVARKESMNRESEYERCGKNAISSPESASDPDVAMDKFFKKVNEGVDALTKYANDEGAKREALIKKKCGEKPKPSYATVAEDANKGELSEEQYAIAIERIVPFCHSGGLAKIRGEGALYYVYKPIEVSSLQPKCKVLMDLINQTTN